jgi:predicted lipoprotein with Yx(FWY)xxD motif
MNKGTQALVGLIVIIVVAAGGYAIFHKSSKTSSPSYSTPANTKSSSGQAASAANNAAVNNAVLTTKSNSSVGSYLADPNGNTLYTYGSDSSGTSNCTGSCISTWPAYKDTGATTGLPTNVSTIKRSDNGQTQYTYKGKPLYIFSSDSKGQVTGDGVNNFSVAKP